jgi:hypothetical protein
MRTSPPKGGEILPHWVLGFQHNEFWEDTYFQTTAGATMELRMEKYGAMALRKYYWEGLV